MATVCVVHCSAEVEANRLKPLQGMTHPLTFLSGSVSLSAISRVASSQQSGFQVVVQQIRASSCHT
eukprot:8135967-Lingulodinium_polyedra.AAC.1